mgnify:FL=1
MSDTKIISPCISICKSNPATGFCYGCARTDEEKKIWKNPDTTDLWKEKNLNILKTRMSESQLKTFKQSYEEKIKLGKLVYSKNLKNKPQN